MNDYAPGKLTMMTAIQFAIERGCRFMDLLRGDEPYKAHWRAVPKPCHDLRAWKDHPRGRLEWSAWSAYTWAARRLKRILPLRLVHQVLELFQSLKDAWGSLRCKVAGLN